MLATAQRALHVRPTVRELYAADGDPMSDAYVYYFMAPDAKTGESMLSTRPATLAAIEGKGEALMESQIVVDQTELDASGFLIASVGKDSYAVNDLSSQIESLELRATSRDCDASKLNDGTEGADKYMLSLESRELRGQSRRLRNKRTDLIADELNKATSARPFIEFGRRLPTTD